MSANKTEGDCAEGHQAERHTQGPLLFLDTVDRDHVPRHGGVFTLSALFITGIILIAIGLTIALVAVFTLRRSYSSSLVIREDHQLIRHGIYRYVRHPVYSGTCVALFGMPLCLSSLFGLGIMLLVIPLFLNRIKIEEALLIEEFGAEYESYRETTRKLIPFVY
jgi:protein-S-isoprenylcysteine O-methyltransferase Ste14